MLCFCTQVNMRICKYANMRICNYANMQICKYADIHIEVQDQVKTVGDKTKGVIGIAQEL